MVEDNRWKETLRDIYDKLLRNDSALARQLIEKIEGDLPDYFGMPEQSKTATEQELARIRAIVQDGNRPLGFTREALGRMAMEALAEARKKFLAAHGNISYGTMEAIERQCYCDMAEAVARWAIIGDAGQPIWDPQHGKPKEERKANG